LKIAYLVNQYPLVSHSFIRREIRALESRGLQVERITIRRGAGELVDADDRQELARTRAILEAGAPALTLALLAAAASRPIGFLRALGCAVRLARRSGRGLTLHLVYLAEAALLCRWLAAAGVGHLHAHFGTNPAAVALLCRTLGGPPYSFTVHGPEEFDRPEALALREKIAGAAFAVAISDFGRSQLFRWARFEDWPRLHVVRCGLDRTFLGKADAAPPADPRLVCVARMSEQKGHLILLEAAGRLLREGRALEIDLIGDGPLRAEIECRVEALGLGGAVRLLGWQGAPEVRERIRAARALVLPSFAEGLPVVIMEAFALGRPVVATAVAGVPELVEAGVSGWLVPAGSTEALAAAMRSALDAPVDELRRLGSAGAARVAELHDADREAARLERLFAGGAP
jgi:glycosyltransferase involved in cell wall biosynthesis